MAGKFANVLIRSFVNDLYGGFECTDSSTISQLTNYLIDKLAHYPYSTLTNYPYYHINPIILITTLPPLTSALPQISKLTNYHIDKLTH